MVGLSRVRPARRAPDLHRRPGPGGRVHRRSLEGVGRQARRRQRHVFPDRQGARRAKHEQRERDGGRQRREAHVQGRPGDHVPAQHGREADDRRRPDPVRRVRPAGAVGGNRRLRGRRSEGQDRDLSGPAGTEDDAGRFLPAAQRPRAQCGGERGRGSDRRSRLRLRTRTRGGSNASRSGDPWHAGGSARASARGRAAVGRCPTTAISRRPSATISRSFLPSPRRTSSSSSCSAHPERSTRS